jgi:AcrR family transcriptional regulator
VKSPTLRDVQRETTRARLIEIVIEMMEGGGEQAVRVRAVADELGASVGAVYHHFGSREDMIVAARIHQFGGALSEDISVFQACVDQSDTIEEFAKAALALNAVSHGPSRAGFRQQRAEVVGAARHNPQLGEALAKVQHARTTDFAASIRAAQAKGFIEPSIDPTALATYFQAVALGLSLADINTLQPLDQDAWAALALQIVTGLTPGSPGSGSAGQATD